jgi:hypothetical protein
VLESGREGHVLQAKQVEHLLHALGELGAQQPATPLSQQGGRRHGGGVAHDGPVDALANPVAELFDEAPLLGDDLDALVVGELLTPIAQRLGEGDRLAEMDADAAEAPLEHAAGAHQAEHALLRLLASLELLHHGALFHQALVGDGDGHEEEVAPRAGEEGLDVPGEHAEPRGQRLARPRAAALDEELLGEALPHEVADVATEDLLVEPVVEGAAQEEGARASEDEAHGTESHVLPRRDVRRHEVVAIEEPREDQEVEVGAVARHEHDGMALGVVGHLLEADGVDRPEQAPEDPAHDDAEDGEEARVHVGGDLAEGALGLRAHDLDRAPPLRRDLLEHRLQARIAEHVLLHLVAGAQGGALDHLLLAVQEQQQAPPHLAHDGVPALVATLRDERRQVHRLAHLDAEIAVGGEEGGDLGEVRRPRGRAVGQVHEARLRTRALAPEQGQGHEEDGPALAPDSVDDLLEQVEIALALLHPAAAPAQARKGPRGAQEQEHRLAGPRELPHPLPCLLQLAIPAALPGAAAAAPASEPQTQTFEHGAVVVEVDAVAEARQAQTFAREERVEQEVVEPARVAHHVHDRASLLEGAQLGDGGVVQVEVPEVATCEPAEQQIEAGRHRRVGIGDLGAGFADRRRS